MACLGGKGPLVATPKKILLPHLTLTEVVGSGDDEAVPVAIAASPHRPEETYFVRPLTIGVDGKRRDGKPRWVKSQFNLFPVVLDSHGVPWAEATVYLLSRLESVTAPAMATYASIAEDLAAYRRFLDETGIDWSEFPSQRLSRPTYRYNAHLKFAVGAGEVAATTAKRRMSAVIASIHGSRRKARSTPRTHHGGSQTDTCSSRITWDSRYRRPLPPRTCPFALPSNMTHTTALSMMAENFGRCRSKSKSGCLMRLCRSAIPR